MATFEGRVSIEGLPVHRGASVSLVLFRVESADAQPPYDGDPPPEACVDAVDVCDEGLGDDDFRQTQRQWPFGSERMPGYYFVQIRVILYQVHREKAYAQAEQFFFRRRPIGISAEGLTGITFPVAWPAESIDKLNRYGTVHPSGSRE